MSPVGVRSAAGLRWMWAVLAAVVALALLELFVGSYGTTPGDTLAALLWPDTAPAVRRAVVWDIRLPRIAAAIVCGATLGCAGVALQGLLRNPLAEPALIGTSSGAALGAAAMLVLGVPALATLQAGGGAEVVGAHVSTVGRAAGTWVMLVPLTAVLGAAIATAVVVVTAQRSSGPSTATVVLAGIAINALTGAGIGLLAHVADDARLRDMTVWMLGSVGQVGQGALPWMVVPAALAGLWLWRESAGLDALLLGESEAWHLGVDVQRLQQRVIAACALGVGASVAFTGPIGFVGLVAPHVLRSAVGPAHALLMPAAAAGGAALLLASDLIARTVVAPTELPIGVVTGLLGGPFFFALLLRGVTKGELG